MPTDSLQLLPSYFFGYKVFLFRRLSGKAHCAHQLLVHAVIYLCLKVNVAVCNDAMEMLDQIVIFRGCEPTVIISYVALVREVYLHACTNLKGKNISLQERFLLPFPSIKTTSVDNLGSS